MTPYSSELIKIQVNGVFVDVMRTITLEQDLDIDVNEFDETLRAELTRDLESGAVEFVVVVVKYQACGCTGFDSLGGVLINHGESVLEAVFTHDMFSEAEAHLILEMQNQFQALKRIWEKV